MLGPLARIDATADRVGLTGPGGTALFGVVGYDAEGNTAPIEPADLKLDYDRDAAARSPPPGTATSSVTALAGTGSALVTVRVGTHAARCCRSPSG